MTDIAAFSKWLIDTLPRCQFQLKFSPSKFVPGGGEAFATGLEQVLQNYMWKVTWSDYDGDVASSDWASTQVSLGRLSRRLHEAQRNGDNENMLEACLAVLRWGGVSGAKAFLRRKSNEGQLVTYLNEVQQLLALDGAQCVEDINENVIEQFDSGMTKIHALLDTTGSPIYDSRVGAAMAMLLELFRQKHPEHDNNPTLKALRFPSGAARGKQVRNPDFLGSKYRGAPQFYTRAVTPAYWAQSQLKLGWLIRDVLARTN